MKHNKKLVTVYSKDGMYLIKTPNGEMMPCLQWIRVSDNWPEQPYLIARMDCNIANNNEPFDEPVQVYNQSEVDDIQIELKEKYKQINELKESVNFKEFVIQNRNKELMEIKSKWWYKLFKNL